MFHRRTSKNSDQFAEYNNPHLQNERNARRASIRSRSEEVNEEFLESTSFAAFRQIGRSPNHLQRYCWKVLCVILLIILSLQISKVIQTYREFNVSTTNREKHAEEDGIPFPSFTFCNMGKFFNPHTLLPNGTIERSAGKTDILRSWGMDPFASSYLKKFEKEIEKVWTNDRYQNDRKSKPLSAYNNTFSGYLDEWGYKIHNMTVLQLRFQNKNILQGGFAKMA